MGNGPVDGASAPRARRHRLCTVLLVLIVLVLGAGVALWAYGHSLSGSVRRTNALDTLPSSAPRPTPAPSAAGAMNILLLGSDSRDPDATAGSRTDTIMLLHVDADHRHAYVISLPRDTWVYVPASRDGRHGDTMAKINAAYAWGGVGLTVQTVEHFTRVRVEHVVLIDFAGFRRVVDALGGVDMTVDKTITSIFPPHRTYTKGRHHFNGAQALDYVRQRYQYPDGDFTRQRHQQQFLNAMLTRATDSGVLANPLRLNDFLHAVADSVTVDKNFDLVGTALRFRHLRSSDVTYLTSPSRGTGWQDGQSVVFPDPDRAAALYRAVRDDTVGAWQANRSSPSTTPTATVSP